MKALQERCKLKKIWKRGRISNLQKLNYVINYIKVLKRKKDFKSNQKNTDYLQGNNNETDGRCLKNYSRSQNSRVSSEC
jgi:hypothetical protein